MNEAEAKERKEVAAAAAAEVAGVNFSEADFSPRISLIFRI